MDIQAGQERAAATFNAQRIAQRTKEILSEQQLAAASGGGDSTDGTAMALRKEAVRNGSMDELLEIAMAEDRARQTEYQAEATRKGGAYKEKLGKDRAQAALIRGASTIIKGATDWSSMGGGTKPPG